MFAAIAVILWGFVVFFLGIAAALGNDAGDGDDRKFVGYFWLSVAAWVVLWVVGWLTWRRRGRP